MKKGVLLIMFILFMSSLIGCVGKVENRKIELSLNLLEEEVTHIDEDISVELIVNKNNYTIEVLLPSNLEAFDLYINNIKIDKELYSITSSKLVYNFEGKTFVDENLYRDVLVTLELGNSYIEKSFLTHFDYETEINITSKDNHFTEDFGVFKKGETGLKFHQKLFLKHVRELDIYIPVLTNQGTDKVEDLNVLDYDYIITSHTFNKEIINNPDLNNLFNNNVLNKIIVFDKDLYDEGNVIMRTYNKNNLSFVKKGNTEVNLPNPFYANVIFKGWSNGSDLLTKIPKIIVGDNVNFINIKPEWENISQMELEKYLKNIIPEKVNSNLYLPKEYAGYEIDWESDNEAILTNEGVYTMPYQYEDINLVATATDLKGVKTNITLNLKPQAKKELKAPLASSYIYRLYEETDDYFFDTLDVINTAFILADANGNLSGTSYLNNIKKYIIPEARKYGSWVIMSVGPSSDWSSFSKSNVALENFANNIVNIINEYGLDGVDIDWETPKVGEEPSYFKLMKIVYEKVKANNPNHLVTTAITGGPYQPPRYDLVNSGKYIDYINVMTYGMSGNGGSYQNALYSTSTFHNQALGVGRSGGRVSIHDSVKIFTDYGMTKEQLIMGVAFYGMKQIRTNNNGTWSNWTQSVSVDYYGIQTLLSNNNYEEYFDERTKVPYIIKKDGTEFYSYDNTRSIIEKSNYVKTEKLGGIMFWEYAHDTSNTLLKAIKTGLGK